MSVSIKPLEDRIVVRPLEAEQTTASGLVIPDTAKEKPQEGQVVAVGPGRVAENGTRVPVDVAEGDVVLYSKYGGESHLTPERQAADARRDAWLLARGCPTLRVNRLDHREGYRRVIGLVRDRLEQTDGPGGP